MTVPLPILAGNIHQKGVQGRVYVTKLCGTEHLLGYEQSIAGVLCVSLHLRDLPLANRFDAHPLDGQHSDERDGYWRRAARRLLGARGPGGRADLRLQMAPGAGGGLAKILGIGAARIPSLPQMSPDCLYALL